MNLTNDQKINFVKNVKDENFLRTEILIPIFQNIGNYKVYDLHGHDEKGKDIVLVSESPLRNREYTAVIVKRDDITNAATSRDKEIVANVQNQIVMSLDSGFSCLETKKKVYFSSILIVTSGKISNSAREAFVEIANKHRFNNIIFWETQNIIDNIDKYLPDIYLISSGTLSKYFHDLKERCENMTELNNITLYDGKDRKVSEIFIEPKLIRRVEYVENEKTKIRFEDSTLYNLIKKKGYILLKGDAGTGKSTLLRSITGRIITDFELKREKKVPILLKLKMLVRNYEEPVEDYLSTYLALEYSISCEEFEKILADYEIVFLLDGYDELVTEAEKDVFKKLVLYIQKITNIVIITSRNKRLQPPEELSNFQEWKLSDFSFGQIKSFLNKWFDKKNEKLIEQLKDHNLLEKLPNTPLVMTLVAILFEADDNTEVPSNLSELYSMFVDLLLGKWNLDRRLNTMHKANDKETYLESLAVYLHMNNKISCSDDELIEVFQQTTKKMGKSIDIDQLLDELVNETNLICINEYREYQFRHLSFQEFLVGKKLTVKSDLTDIIPLLPSPWWDQVVYFFCGVRKENEDILPKIFEVVDHLDNRKKMLHLINLGYLVQSSYKTDARIREKIIIDAMNEYSASIEDFISNISEEYDAPRVIRYIMLIETFKMHYSSRYIKEIHERVYEELQASTLQSREQVLSLLISCLLLAENGELEYLSDNDKHFSRFPDLSLIEDFFLRCDLLEDESDKNKKKEIKEIAAKITKRIRKNPKLYKNILNEK
ncbi:NACHT domain-containing protein [Marispirochaeta aestuarii]|uniref:NACHT domain-containing protein n=1 Tax=Marispirochaeta aestuarii TaxID=1963862 RepID=UPI002ABD8F24|nr:NACHT domain-containing protein [Marispirochaeta aestuarii]